MTITLPTGAEVLEDERQIWGATEYRCVVHPHFYGVCLHEEPPRSRNPRWKEEPLNRYVLCNLCHEYVHTLPRQEAKRWLDFNRNLNFPSAEVMLHG